MAKAMSNKTNDPAFIEIEAVSTAAVTVCLLGQTALLQNRLAEKARHELLLPSPKKNAAEKAMNLKHIPYEEFVASMFRVRDEDELPTRLIIPGGAFRKAIAAAALDIPGSSKSQIGRLVRIVENNVPVYGLPQISCMIVRQAGIQKTPDVRTLRNDHPLCESAPQGKSDHDPACRRG